MSGNKKILVIGGGISGISAAIEASEAGAEVLLVEKEPYLGGRVAQMNLYFPKLCPPTCGLEINLKRFRASSKIRYLTQAEVSSIEGEPGNYQVTIQKKPRLVNTKCTACGDCVEACPAERDDQYNVGMAKTKAIYIPFPTAYPLQFVIDQEACRGNECSECVKACSYGAIDLDMQPETLSEEVGSVIVTTGWSPYDANQLDYLNYGKLPNIITNIQMERLASLTGPTAGKVLRPSDNAEIQSIAFVQCAGSRDENYLAHCSGVCCMGSLKQVRYVRERYPEAQIFVFYIDIRSPGRLEDFYQEVQKDEKVTFIKGKVAKISPGQSEGSVVVEAEDILNCIKIRKEVDLAVLATGIVANDPGINGNVQKDDHGFMILDKDSGIFPAGCARRPVEVAESVRDATGAALRAIQTARG